jgi:hypothetical protein
MTRVYSAMCNFVAQFRTLSREKPSLLFFEENAGLAQPMARPVSHNAPRRERRGKEASNLAVSLAHAFRLIDGFQGRHLRCRPGSLHSDKRICVCHGYPLVQMLYFVPANESSSTRRFLANAGRKHTAPCCQKTGFITRLAGVSTRTFS